MSQYAYVVEGIIIDVLGANLPDSGFRQDTGEFVPNLPGRSIAIQEACGYFVIVEVSPPIPTATERLEGPAINMVNGRPSQVWVLRPETSAELAERQLRELHLANYQELLAKARNAVTANNNFLAQGTHSNTQIINQVELMTRELTGIIRLIGSIIRIPATPGDMDDLLDNTQGT